jgi:hypothetical protein
MTLAKSADRWIAGHGAHSGKLLGHESGPRAHARRGGSGLATGVPAAHHNHIETIIHPTLQIAIVLVKPKSEVKSASVSRETGLETRVAAIA